MARLAAHAPPLVVVRLARRHGADHLGDHVAGALQDHVVAGADVLAPDVVLVVQGGALDGHAADEHGLEHGERRQDARPPHVHLDECSRVTTVVGANLKAIAQRGS